MVSSKLFVPPSLFLHEPFLDDVATRSSRYLATNGFRTHNGNAKVAYISCLIEFKPKNCLNFPTYSSCPT